MAEFEKLCSEIKQMLRVCMRHPRTKGEVPNQKSAGGLQQDSMDIRKTKSWKKQQWMNGEGEDSKGFFRPKTDCKEEKKETEKQRYTEEKETIVEDSYSKTVAAIATVTQKEGQQEKESMEKKNLDTLLEMGSKATRTARNEQKKIERGNEGGEGTQLVSAITNPAATAKIDDEAADQGTFTGINRKRCRQPLAARDEIATSIATANQGLLHEDEGVSAIRTTAKGEEATPKVSGAPALTLSGKRSSATMRTTTMGTPPFSLKAVGFPHSPSLMGVGVVSAGRRMAHQQNLHSTLMGLSLKEKEIGLFATVRPKSPSLFHLMSQAHVAGQNEAELHIYSVGSHFFWKLQIQFVNKGNWSSWNAVLVHYSWVLWASFHNFVLDTVPVIIAKILKDYRNFCFRQWDPGIFM